MGTRPIPWKLLVAWSIGVGVLTNIAVLAFDADNYDSSVLFGSLIGALGYLVIGAMLSSRTGWRPPQFGAKGREARAERMAQRSASSRSKSAPAPVARHRPAPTSRTNLTNRRTPPRRT
jgi:hypothetical protein